MLRAATRLVASVSETERVSYFAQNACSSCVSSLLLCR